MKAYETIPDKLCKRLHGLTIQQALDQGIINDLGDDEGNFLFKEEEEEEKIFGFKYVAIVQEYLIKCSLPLNEYIENSSENIDELIGDLSFFRYEISGEYECRLGMPNGIKLGKPIFTLSPDEELTPDNNTNSSSKIRLDSLILSPQQTPPHDPMPGTVYFDAIMKKLRLFNGESWEEV